MPKRKDNPKKYRDYTLEAPFKKGDIVKVNNDTNRVLSRKDQMGRLSISFLNAKMEMFCLKLA